MVLIYYMGGNEERRGGYSGPEERGQVSEFTRRLVGGSYVDGDGL